MSHRLISGLLWARPAEKAPFRQGKGRGAKAAGLRYERALARSLPGGWHGHWYEFEDRNGRGFCQPDLVLVWKGRLVVLEAKYTWVAEAHSQIERLYRPVLEMAHGHGVGGVVVCRGLVPGMPPALPVIRDLPSALALAISSPSCPVLHWLGEAPLLPRAVPAQVSHTAPLALAESGL